MVVNTFPKSERLHSKKLIDELFNKGSSFVIYPLKVFYLIKSAEEVDQHQVLVSVPKKIFKRAVDRNKLKRRIKEAFRLHKQALEPLDSHKFLLIGYIYIGKEFADYSTIEDKLKRSLSRLTKKHDQ